MSTTNLLTVPAGYADWLAEIKARVTAARQRAVLAANAELMRLYWQIGRDILDRQASQGWGAKVIERLARDLSDAFPEIKGFSARNLKYMRFFAEHCPNQQFGQQPAAQLPWFHIVTLLTHLTDDVHRAWYAEQAIQHGWSRTTLSLSIKHRDHERQGGAVTNFAARLPAPHSDLAQETLKDPYLFDFLGLGKDAHEREIENALVRHITRFLLELGTGFAFIGRQQRLEVAGDEFFIDLLFYHTRLKCYVVVELKATAFKPEHAGQLNFYLSAVDAQIKAPDDKPTIGLLLCKSQNRLVAEYALSGIDKPIGVAEYQLVRALPEPLVTSLPTVEQLESELADEEFEPPEDITP
jgi:predicted nuclease of restriction endonuclease-like (RecB) superfamily